MATKKKKPRSGSIAARKEELRQAPSFGKSRSGASKLRSDTRKATQKIIDRVGGLGGGIKKVASVLKGIRLPVQGTPAGRKARLAKESKSLADDFTPEAIAKRSAAAKVARQTKEAAKKLTKRRKDTSKKNVGKVDKFKAEVAEARAMRKKITKKNAVEKAVRRVENRLADRKK